MQLTVPVPTLSTARVRLPLPSLSPNELLFAGAVAALGLAEVISPPVAIVVASAPLFERGLRRLSGEPSAGMRGSRR